MLEIKQKILYHGVNQVSTFTGGNIVVHCLFSIDKKMQNTYNFTLLIWYRTGFMRCR